MPFTQAENASPSWFPTWMVETVRHLEERAGPYDDGPEIRQAGSGTPQQRLTRRNLALAVRTGLVPAAQRALHTARWALLGLALAALVSGMLAARSVLGAGNAPVNLLWALLGLLGLHAITLFLWVLSLPLARRLHSVPARLLVWVTQWRNRGHHSALSAPACPAAATLAPALLQLLQRARLLQPLAGLLSQGWWLLALCSAWVTLAVLFATRQYGFLWETTLLSPQAFIALAQTLSLVPEALGFTAPDAALTARTVNGLALTAAEQALWSRWLLACLLVYGILPRLLLALACASWAWWHRHALRPHWQAPGLAVQLTRLQNLPASLGIQDPAPSVLAVPTAPARPDSARILAAPAWQSSRQALGLELPNDLPWPSPDLPADYADAGNLTHRQSRNALLAAYAQHAPTALIIAVDARQTPDRGTMTTLRELQRHVPTADLWLLTPADHPARLAQWKARLADSEVTLPQTIKTTASGTPRNAGTTQLNP